MVLRQPMERLILQAGTLAGFDDSGWAAAQQVAEVQAPTGTLVEQDQPAYQSDQALRGKIYSQRGSG